MAVHRLLRCAACAARTCQIICASIPQSCVQPLGIGVQILSATSFTRRSSMIARRVFVGLTFLLLIAFLAQASPETPTARPRFKSPLGLAIDPTGQFAYVALHTADALAMVDLQK